MTNTFLSYAPFNVVMPSSMLRMRLLLLGCIFGCSLWSGALGAQTPQQRLQEWQQQNHFVERMMSAKSTKRSSLSSIKFVKNDDRNAHTFLQPRVQRELDRLTMSRLSSGNRVQLLLNHASSVEKFKLVDEAKETLFLSALLFHCDEGGKKLMRKLIRAKHRGVDVRMVIDGVGAWAGIGCFQTLRKEGIPVVISGRSLSPITVDWEMHDKLFVQDGVRAVVGGQNLGSWYFDANGTDNNYRDSDVRVEGPVVRDIARRFIRIWEELRPKDASLDAYAQQLEQLDIKDVQRERIGQNHYETWLSDDKGKGVCRFVSQDPHRNTFYVFEAYTYLAEMSSKRVRFHAMSFSPTGSMRQDRLLAVLKQLASEKGAVVEVITNGPGLLTSKAMPAQLGGWFGSSFLSNVYVGLRDTSIRVHAYETFLHSKVYSFDDVAVAIGSFNYDPSGIRCQESTLICVDEDLASEVNIMFERDLEKSVHVPVLASTTRK